MKEVSPSAQQGLKLLHPISHDLKAPLNRILGLAQLINFSRDNLDDDQQNYLDRIRQITSDALDMISNMIDAYNLEQDDFEETIEPVEMQKIISSRIQSYADIAQLKNINLSFEIAVQKSLEVVTDKLLLGRIIDNLLSNAIKFSELGKNIFVKLEEKENAVLFSVRDEGPGIGEKDKKLLYKKFQRLSVRPTVGETTTCLGLYVTKTMLEKINGEIECESIPRKGTQFTVTLWKKTADEAAQKAHKHRTTIQTEINR